jgi:hypothetical protein
LVSAEENDPNHVGRPNCLADTKWIDLLRILGKLNDGKDYSDDDIEAMDWQKKTSQNEIPFV